MAPVGTNPTGAIALYGGGIWRLIARALSFAGGIRQVCSGQFGHSAARRVKSGMWRARCLVLSWQCGPLHFMHYGVESRLA